jgi:large subunit ribosomal protein L3
LTKIFYVFKETIVKALIGRKIGMTQIIDEQGTVIPITVLQAGPCVITSIKSIESDGYNSIQLGFEIDKKASKPQLKQYKKVKEAPKVIREFRTLTDEHELAAGTTLNVESFEVGDLVTVRGTSKGKGFAGTVKRHNFNTGPKSHGSSNYRKPGSIGSMYPQKVMKGKKMAGQMGSAKTTVKNQTVALIDPKHNLIGVHGNVPGPRKSLVTIEGTS